MDFKDKIKMLRLEQGITQKDLATIIGVGRTTISEYESGKIVPSQQKLLKIAQHFNVSVDYLTGNTETKQPIPNQEIRIEKIIENVLNLTDNRSSQITLYGKPLNDYTAEIIKVEVDHLLTLLKIIR